MRERAAYVTLIKQIHDGLEKQANNSLRAQDLTMSHVAQSTAAGIVARLEQKGFVEGFGDASDRRIKMLRITPAGEACCRLADRRMAAFEEALLTGLTEAERDTFFSLLKRVAGNLK